MTCPVCGSGRSTAYSGSTFQIKGIETAFHLEQCSGCGIVFTAPQPDQAMLDRLYADNSYYSYQPFLRPPADAKTGLLASLRRWAKSLVVDHHYRYGFRNEDFKTNALARWAGWVLKGLAREDMIAAKRAVPFVAHGAHLDIGCGSGGYIDWMKRLGWNSQGIEVSTEAAKAAERADLDVRNSDLLDAGFADGAFDLVTAWEVLEHLPRLSDQLREVGRILKPGGKLVGSVPNIASWEAVLFGAQWQPLEIPYHLYHFSPVSLRRIMRSTGFRLEHIEFIGVTHSWDASLGKRNHKPVASQPVLRAFGPPFYLFAAAAGRGARIKFTASILQRA